MDAWTRMQIRILRSCGYTSFERLNGRWFCRIGYEPWTHQPLGDAWAASEARFTSAHYA